MESCNDKQCSKSGASSHVLGFSRGASAKNAFESPELPLAALKPRCRPAGASIPMRNFASPASPTSNLAFARQTHPVQDSPRSRQSHNHDCPASRNNGAAPRYGISPHRETIRSHHPNPGHQMMRRSNGHQKTELNANCMTM